MNKLCCYSVGLIPAEFQQWRPRRAPSLSVHNLVNANLAHLQVTQLTFRRKRVESKLQLALPQHTPLPFIPNHLFPLPPS
ncbi:hypothetical protein ACTXT7_000845 [Hymenolepis weldensis]